MLTILQFINKLPLDVQLNIFEYDPNRRVMMNKLITMLPLYVPYWYFRKGLWIMSLNYDPTVSLIKNRVMNTLCADSECYNCGDIKSSSMILKYLDNRMIYCHGGMYCDECLQSKY